MKPTDPTAGVYFRHLPFLLAIQKELAANAGHRPTESSYWEASAQAIADDYAPRLKREVEADLTGTDAVTHPRFIDRPGIEFDLVELAAAAPPWRPPTWLGRLLPQTYVP